MVDINLHLLSIQTVGKLFRGDGLSNRVSFRGSLHHA